MRAGRVATNDRQNGCTPGRTPGRTGRALRWTALIVGLLAFILVPFFLFGEDMEASARQALVQTSSWWWGAGLLIAGLLAVDVLLPVPSSLVSTAAGAILGMAPGALVSWLGMTVACELGYHLGRRAGRGAMQRLIGPEEWQRVEAATQRHGAAALVLFRPVPVLAEASVIFAGATRMSRGRYLALTAAANLIISLVYAIIGMYARGVLSPG